MNRIAAAIGLTLSLSLHAGLWQFAKLPTDPLLAPTVKVALRQVGQPDEPAVTSPPAELQAELPDQTPEQTAPPASEPPPPLTVKPPQIKPEPSPIVPAEPPKKPETVVARPPAPALPTPPDLASPPLPAESPPDPLEIMDRDHAAPPSRSTPRATPAPPATSAAASVTETHRPVATQPAGEITPPSYIPRSRPYPRLAKQRGWEGTVKLQVDIATDGSVTRVLLEQSSGYPLLDQAAIRHISQSRFRPARRNGTPIDISVQLPVVFELK